MAGLLLAASVASCSDGRDLPALSSPAASSSVSATIASLADAWRRGDAAAASAAADPGSPGLAERLSAIAQNARSLDLVDLAVAYRGSSGAEPLVDGARWSGSVAVTWRVADLDSGTATVALPLEMVWHGDRALVAELGAGASRLPLWLAGPVTGVSGRGWQLVSAGATRDLAPLVTATRRALDAVARVVRQEPALVVEVPADAAAYEAALGARPGEFAALAAVTSTADGSTEPTSPRRVVVNPDQLTALDPAALQVVLAHETVHVVFSDATSSAPLWFREGFADYVALRGLRLQARLSAARADVRRAGVPRQLPRQPDFRSSGERLEAAYERSWLACRVIVDQAGEQALLRLRAAASAAGTSFPSALRRITGLTPGELLRRWRIRLGALVAAPSGGPGRGGVDAEH